MSRVELAWASAYNMASTGVAPIPADSRSTGEVALVRVNRPRGADISRTASARILLCTKELKAPPASRFTLTRYSDDPGGPDRD
jgi:hypothetical protein